MVTGKYKSMRNEEVAWIFQELAGLMEVKEEDFFKIRAYKNAARILAELEEPLEEIRRRGDLTKIPGIGKNIAAKINEILTTGRLQKLEDLSKEIPPGLLDIVSLPGIGLKRAAQFRDDLGITSLGELAKAARAGLAIVLTDCIMLLIPAIRISLSCGASRGTEACMAGTWNAIPAERIIRRR